MVKNFFRNLVSFALTGSRITFIPSPVMNATRQEQNAAELAKILPMVDALTKEERATRRRMKYPLFRIDYGEEGVSEFFRNCPKFRQEIGGLVLIDCKIEVFRNIAKGITIKVS